MQSNNVPNSTNSTTADQKQAYRDKVMDFFGKFYPTICEFSLELDGELYISLDYHQYLLEISCADKTGIKAKLFADEESRWYRKGIDF